MKKFKRLIYSLLLVMALSIISPSVINFPGQINKVEAAVKINKKKATLIKGQTTTLKISGTKKKAKWSSSKKSVATVSSKGKVTAKKKGTATITAKIGNKKYTCKVTVQTPKISSSKITLSVGETSKLKVNGTDQKITWKSANKKIATVDKNGKVTGKKAGSVKITATVLKKKYTCTVLVSKKTVKKFNEIEADKKINKTIYEMNGEIICLLKSNYSFPTSVTANCYFFDKNGKAVGDSYSYCFWLEFGREGVLSFREPEVDYAYYDIKYDFFQSFAYLGNESILDKINISTNYVQEKYNDKIYLRVDNKWNKTIDNVDVIIKYYNKSNKLTAIKNYSIYDIKANDYKIEETYIPYNYLTYEDIDFYRFEAIISTATYY